MTVDGPKREQAAHAMRYLDFLFEPVAEEPVVVEQAGESVRIGAGQV